MDEPECGRLGDYRLVDGMMGHWVNRLMGGWWMEG